MFVNQCKLGLILLCKIYDVTYLLLRQYIYMCIDIM